MGKYFNRKDGKFHTKMNNDLSGLPFVKKFHGNTRFQRFFWEFEIILHYFHETNYTRSRRYSF